MNVVEIGVAVATFRRPWCESPLAGPSRASTPLCASAGARLHGCIAAGLAAVVLAVGGCGGGAAETPSGYVGGGDLPSSAIGDSVKGAQLFEQKLCSDCHSYDGKGGHDASALDSMKGRLSATQIANMSGKVWNHLPQMLAHFNQEAMPVPIFSGNEMADLIAYLHGGQAADGGTQTPPPDPIGGQDLTSSAIGDSAKGVQMFEQKRCSDCHSYDGKGGGDAPPLDFMKGRLSASEIANMAGTLWNHEPQMLSYFEQHGIPVPTFADDEMADLIAYLHGGPPQ